jgi:cytochrome c5
MGGIKARLGAAGAIILVAGSSAPTPAQEQRPAEPKPVAKDYYQRSLQTFEFKKAAQSGAERGREIFYYKCWFCHNESAPRPRISPASISARRCCPACR